MFVIFSVLRILNTTDNVAFNWMCYYSAKIFRSMWLMQQWNRLCYSFVDESILMWKKNSLMFDMITKVCLWTFDKMICCGSHFITLHLWMKYSMSKTEIYLWSILYMLINYYELYYTCDNAEVTKGYMLYITSQRAPWYQFDVKY